MRILVVALAALLSACAASKPAESPPVSADAAPANRSPAMRSAKRIPVPLLAHQLTPAAIKSAEAEARATAEGKLAALANIPDGQRNFANTLDALEQAVIDYADAAQRLGILKDVHPDADVRAAAAEAEETSSKFLINVAARRDLYKAVKGYVDGNGKGELPSLEAQQRRLVELTMRDFKRAGLELSDGDLAKLVKLRERIAELQTQFQKNLNENTDSVTVTAAEAEGAPEALLSRLTKTKDGQYVVTTKTPDYVPFMETVRSADARKRLYVAYMSREAGRNIPLLKEAIKLRDEAAKLLGYPTHADYVTEDRMAKSAANVKAFLDDMRRKLRPRRDADLAKLADLKRAETKDANAKVEPWDVSYYLAALKKRDYALDNEKIREFFPMQTVVAGMFDVYQTLLGVRFEEQPNPDVWSPDVKLFAVHDAQSDERLAYFYLDLHPRKGKYGHAACAPVTFARETPEGYRTPLAVMMANFTPPSKDRPSLMTHDEVRTLFHEFGHIMHQTLTTARYGSQAGSNVAGDFVEAPSQMLENWVFQPEVLDKMSGHYKDGSKLPRETIAKIKEARFYNAGWVYTRQNFLGTFDQALHTSGPEVDPDAFDAKLYGDILGLTPVPNTHFAASFGHLMGGYDAGYYGYMWSEVYSADMWSRFEKEGPLNSELGRRYRETVLAKGRSADPDVLLTEFLGRKPSNEAFLKELGL